MIRVKYATKLPDIVCFQYGRLPVEVRESLLKKAFLAMFLSLGGTSTPGNDVAALSTLLSVCRDWWWLIAGRNFNRRRLKTAIECK